MLSALQSVSSVRIVLFVNLALSDWLVWKKDSVWWRFTVFWRSYMLSFNRTFMTTMLCLLAMLLTGVASSVRAATVPIEVSSNNDRTAELHQKWAWTIRTVLNHTMVIIWWRKGSKCTPVVALLVSSKYQPTSYKMMWFYYRIVLHWLINHPPQKQWQWFISLTVLLLFDSFIHHKPVLLDF